MRVLIVHSENTYFGGAEKVLGYFLEEVVRTDCQVAVAAVQGGLIAGLLPSKGTAVWIEDFPEFSPAVIWRQTSALKRFHTEFPFDVVHGWAARDWELTWLTAWRSRRPAIGTLHDHPNATFISPKRQRLMGWCAKYGLKKVACVSAAVQGACAEAGYPSHKLAVVRNGLPRVAWSPNSFKDTGPCRLGFLGVFSERKGLRNLFQILERLASANCLDWECHLAGRVQDEMSRRLMSELQDHYYSFPWCQKLHWHGWVESPQKFLATLDLLIVPSREFDPFPTVLLEAGQAGVPVLAARVGGVPEIVIEGQTGWLFEPGDTAGAAGILRRLITEPDVLRQAGKRAWERVDREFRASKMVEEYLRLYADAS